MCNERSLESACRNRTFTVLRVNGYTRPTHTRTRSGPITLPGPQSGRQLTVGVGRAAIDRYLLPAGPTAANPPHAAAAGEWDRQTDGRFIDHIAYCAGSVRIIAVTCQSSYPTSTASQKTVNQTGNQPEHCLHYLLPTAREPSVTDRLRSANKLPRIFAKTNRFKNSFISNSLNSIQCK